MTAPHAAGPPPRVRGPHARVWRIAGPIIVSNVTVPLLGAVDTAVVGRLPDPAFMGAVAVAAVIFSFIYWAFGFLRMGTTGVVAQAYGARDGDELRALLARAGLIAGAIALPLVALQAPIAALSLPLMEASPGVEGLAGQYFAIRIWSAPATLGNYVILGWLLGVQRAGAAMALQIFTNAANIALDVWFVLGLGWGVEGVAAATVIAEYAAAASGLALVLRALAREPGRWRRAAVLDRGRMLGLVRINGDIFVRTVCLLFAFAHFTAQGARMGDAVLAANAILMHFQTFMAYGLDGFAHAAETLVGEAVGARSRRLFDETVRTTTVWAAGLALGFAALYGLAGPAIVGLFTDLPEVRAGTAAFLPWLATLPLVSVWSFQLDGIFIGATRGPDLRNAMIASLAVYLAAAWLLIPAFGNHGLWLAFTLFMVVRAAALGYFYPRLARSLAERL